jgi:putative oxidoreductase
MIRHSRRTRGVVELLDRASGVAMGAVFVRSGVHSMLKPSKQIALVEKAGLPAAGLVVKVNGALMIAGGLGLTMGFSRQASAGLLAVILIPITLTGHRFWAEPQGPARDGQLIHVLKNLAIIGGLTRLLIESTEVRERT